MNWIECPHCGLKHSQRESGRCPRCGKDVTEASTSNEGFDVSSEEIYRPPAERERVGVAATRPMFSMEPVDEDAGLGIGARIAGVVLVLNALSALYAGIALNVPGTGRATSAIVDLVLGALLIFGVRKVIPFCLFRIIVGAIIYLGISLYTADMMTALAQVALSGSLLGLLLGTPSTRRVWLSAGVAVIFLGYVGLALHAGTRARNPEALLASDEIRAIEGDVEGLGFAYHLKVPSEKWFLRSEEATKRDNPVADRWLVRPDRDAHFIIVAEQLPAMGIDVGVYESAVVQSIQNAVTTFEVIESGPLSGHRPQTRFVRARATVRGLAIEYLYSITVNGDIGYQFIGFASQTEYPAVEAELRQMQDSVVIGAGH